MPAANSATRRDMRRRWPPEARPAGLLAFFAIAAGAILGRLARALCGPRGRRFYGADRDSAFAAQAAERLRYIEANGTDTPPRARMAQPCPLFDDADTDGGNDD